MLNISQSHSPLHHHPLIRNGWCLLKLYGFDYHLVFLQSLHKTICYIKLVLGFIHHPVWQFHTPPCMAVSYTTLYGSVIHHPVWQCSHRLYVCFYHLLHRPEGIVGQGSSSRLTIGAFTASPAMGAIPPGGQAVISVECHADNASCTEVRVPAIYSNVRLLLANLHYQLFFTRQS